MSICDMNCDTPQQGGGMLDQGMFWGNNSTDITTIPNLDNLPIVSSGSSVYNSIKSQDNYGYLPSSNFSTLKNPYDASYYTYSNYDRYVPSPYVNVESRNELYYQTFSPSSTANALADFDGRGNTNKILAVRGNKDYAAWKPTYNAQNDYPAASCCDMFSTVGTEQGDWYLPSCGELGYVTVRLKEINFAIQILNSAYPNTLLNIVHNGYKYWSSTEYSTNGARYIDNSNGYIGYDNHKGYYYDVRAFLRVKL